MGEMMRTLVERADGFSVTALAHNVLEARRAVLKHRPALVLLDEVLPGESSLDFLKELEAQGIPVLLMTGMENPSHRIPTQAMGRFFKPGWGQIDDGAN